MKRTLCLGAILLLSGCIEQSQHTRDEAMRACFKYRPELSYQQCIMETESYCAVYGCKK